MQPNQQRTSLKPNDVLPKIMHVKPLVDGEVRIYRLIAADHPSAMVENKDGIRLNNNPARALSRQTEVYDITTGDKVMIGNVVSKKYITLPDGSNAEVGVTAPIKFRDATVRLTKNDFASVQYMERHDGNIDNPYRDKKKQAFFYRVDPKKKAAVANNDIMMKADAILWVSGASLHELKSCAKSLPEGMKVNTDQEVEGMKADLLRLADKNPIAVLKASTDAKSIAKILIMESENYNIIMFEEEKREWFFNDDMVETITTVEIGKNKIEGLLEFFATDEDGKKRYKQIEAKLKRFLNPS